MREFYEFGIPEDVRPRDVDYLEKRNSATVVTGMRRAGKTYATYQRMRALVDSGIPMERIVHVNFDDDRLKGLKLEHLRLVGDIHAEMFPDAAKERCWYFSTSSRTSRVGNSMRVAFLIRTWFSCA